MKRQYRVTTWMTLLGLSLFACSSEPKMPEAFEQNDDSVNLLGEELKGEESLHKSYSFRELFGYSYGVDAFVSVTVDERPIPVKDPIQHSVKRYDSSLYFSKVVDWMEHVTFATPDYESLTCSLNLVRLETKDASKELVISECGIVFVDGFVYRASLSFPDGLEQDGYQYMEFKNEQYPLWKGKERTVVPVTALSSIHYRMTSSVADKDSLKELPRIALDAFSLYVLDAKSFVLDTILCEVVSEADFAFAAEG